MLFNLTRVLSCCYSIPSLFLFVCTHTCYTCLHLCQYQKDLIRRLRTVSKILHEDSNVEPDAIEYPGLAAMASSLVDDYLGHKDKEVRLYAVLCCMELFAIVSNSTTCNFSVRSVMHCRSCV